MESCSRSAERGEPTRTARRCEQIPHDPRPILLQNAQAYVPQQALSAELVGAIEPISWSGE